MIWLPEAQRILRMMCPTLAFPSFSLRYTFVIFISVGGPPAVAELAQLGLVRHGAASFGDHGTTDMF